MEIVSILMIDHESNELKLAASHGYKSESIKKSSRNLGEGITGYVLKIAEPLLIKDITTDERFKNFDVHDQFETPSLLCVPILVEGKVEGVITVNHKRDGSIFDEKDETLLIMFSQNVEYMLANVQLYNQLEERLHELTLLYQINRKISETLDFNELVEYLVASIYEAFNAETVTIALIEQDNKTFTFTHVMGKGKEQFTQKRFPIGEGIIGWCLQKKKSALSNEMTSDYRYSEKMDKQTHYQTLMALCVPLMHGDHVLGAIQIMNKKNNNPFTERERTLLEAIASQTVMVLKNSWLHSSLSEKVKEALANQKRETQLKKVLKEKIKEIEHLKQDSVITFKIEE